MKKSILALVLTSLFFSGCQPKVVYVDRPCPKLHQVHVEKPKGISYEVRAKDQNKR